jgi:putative sugar O-methyltransferase
MLAKLAFCQGLSDIAGEVTTSVERYALLPAALYDAAAEAPPALASMLNTLRGADEIYRPSPFWEKLATEHIAQLEKNGFENFKRTINLRYFNWGLLGIFAQHVMPLAFWWLKSGRGNPLSARIADQGSSDSIYGTLGSRVYATHVALLYQRVLADDTKGVFSRCSESPIGNPIRVQLDPNTIVTQDLCNSVHEYLRATFSTDTPKRVMEIGAGYGRLATVFLDASPGTKYWIVDIPPALYVSQRYLSEVYPDKKIFRFRPFDRFSDVEQEVNDSDICFFLSNQIEMLPDKSVDVSLCVSNLHEMTRAQIVHYFQQIDRLTSGTFYTKQWMRSIARENGFSISQNEYPVMPHWTERFNARHPLQSWFFEAAYDIR